MTRILLAILLFAGCNPTPRSAQEPVSPALAVALGRSGQPDSHPGAQPAALGRITPSPSPTRTRPAATTKPRTATSLRGTATWFRSPSGVSAAGPDLRSALGPDWRGQVVTVTRADLGAAVKVRLTDWCACGDRNGVPTLIDLDRASFAVLAPPSRGIVRVTVSW